MNELTQTILLWGSIAGAIAAVGALIAKIVKVAKSTKKYFTDLKSNVDTLLKHDHSQYMAILRLTVMSDNIPLSERILAGKEYIDADGNGDVKHYYETVLKPQDKIVKGE
jgi:hypothetical protein